MALYVTHIVWEYGLDGKQVPHLARFEYPPLRIDQGNARTLKQEAGLELVRSEVVVRIRQAPDMIEGRCADMLVFPHAVLPFFAILPPRGLRRNLSDLAGAQGHWNNVGLRLE